MNLNLDFCCHWELAYITNEEINPEKLSYLLRITIKKYSTIYLIDPSNLKKLSNDFKKGITKVTWNENVSVPEKHISNNKRRVKSRICY